jgi:hypothetical protein
LGVACRQLDDASAGQHLERSLELRKQLAEKAPEDVGFQQDLALSLARTGKTDESTKIADKLLEKSPEEPSVLYIVASAYALCAAAVDPPEQDPGAGETQSRRQEYLDKALKTLQQAVAHGYQGAALIQIDPDLAPLSEQAEFRNLIAQLRERSSS